MVVVITIINFWVMMVTLKNILHQGCIEPPEAARARDREGTQLSLARARPMKDTYFSLVWRARDYMQRATS